MKKLVFIYVLCFIALCGCDTSAGYTGVTDDTDSLEAEVPEKGDITFCLKSDQKIIDLLEQSIYNIEFSRRVSMSDIREQFDSITWVVSDKEGHVRSYCIMNSDKQIFQWSHNFCYPGTYQTCLVGYKKGLETYRSKALTLEVNALKDFLGWRWDEFPGASKPLSCVNVFNPDFELTYNSQLSDNGVPGWNVYLFNFKGEDDQRFYEQSSASLYRYMVELYGQPSVDRDTADLAAVYAAEFAYHEKDACPLAIWRTAGTRIALLRIEREWSVARIYAEPVLVDNDKE